MNLSSNTPHKKARIEIIPLIDIMFFLLASFMLVSMSMIKLQKIETKLPNSKIPPPPSDKKPNFVIIGIDAKHDIYFDKDKDPIKPDAIPARLQPFYKNTRDDTKVFINCDSTSTYDNLITVLDEVRTLGISKVSFNVKKDNHFDPEKPRPNTHPETDADGNPIAGAAAPAAAPAANP